MESSPSNPTSEGIEPLAQLDLASEAGFIDWCRKRRSLVARRLEESVLAICVGSEQTDLYASILEASRLVSTERGGDEELPSVHLPLLVHAALTGDDRTALSVAVATSAIELGMDILDHIQDQEIGRVLRRFPVSVLLLASTGLLSSMAPTLLSTGPAELTARILPYYAARLRHVGLGQQLDLTEGRRRLRPETALRIAELLSERRALYAGLAAAAAGASPDQVQAFETAGREYGVARKLSSDLHDLDNRSRSRDLASGAQTYPVAWAISQDPSILDLVLRAKEDVSVRESAVERILQAGASLRTRLEIGLRLTRSRAALDGFGPRADPLRKLIGRAAGAAEHPPE